MAENVIFEQPKILGKAQNSQAGTRPTSLSAKSSPLFN